MGLNEDLFLALNGAGNPILDPAMIAFAVIGLFPFTFLWALPLWFRGRRTDAIDFVLVLALAEISVLVLKFVLAVPRPDGIGTVLAAPFDDRSGSAFPSGHTTRAFVAAMFVTLRLRDWRWGVPLFAYATVIGLSRIYLGVHWPSDVLGGALLGIAWAAGFDWFAQRGGYLRFRGALLHRLGRGYGPPA